MEKLDPKTDGATTDIVGQNIKKLKELFPDVFTEGKIDFDSLRETLGDYIDGRQERYSFTWNGKNRARLIAQTPSTGTLRPCPEESVNWDTTQNLFIEGDNLEVLKLLQKSYHRRVKMIYIDPPYNTGNEFIYPDRFQDNLDTYLRYTGQKDEAGLKLSVNAETSGRYHTNWLNMILPRLKLARNLLRDDGVIFISINDSEMANLRKVCDEIFGEENFIATLVWKSRQNKDNRNVTGASVDYEYIICYGRKLRGAARNLDQYTNPDHDSRGPWTSANMVGLLPEDQRPNCHYDLVNPNTGINYEKPTMGWRYDQTTMTRLIEENKILWPPTPGGRPRRKKFLCEIEDKYTGYSSVVAQDTYTHHGTAEVEDLLKFRAFDFPKPIELMKELIIQGLDDERDAIVLDFFSGSCSTAQAVLELNIQDGYLLRFIMVQLPEPCPNESLVHKAGYRTIADIGKERIHRVIKKIESEQAEKTCTVRQPLRHFCASRCEKISVASDRFTLQSSLNECVCPS